MYSHFALLWLLQSGPHVITNMQLGNLQNLEMGSLKEIEYVSHFQLGLTKLIYRPESNYVSVQITPLWNFIKLS